MSRFECYKPSVSVFVGLLLCAQIAFSSLLETVANEELTRLVQNEKHVIVLFSTRNCPPCEALERELTAIREDLVDALNAWVVKVESNPVVQQYTPVTDTNFEPKLVFFRKGVPMLYEGPANEEVMLETLLQNQEPIAQELTDETFEHLTQAATGATTGDWFVLFYRPDNEPSQRLMARWETLGASLKNRVNVAKVNVQGPGVSTASRLGVQDVPAFVFLRQGRMYHYNLPKHDLSMFADFASGWYRNVPAKSIPVPPSPFDELIDRIVFFIKENLLLVQIGSGVSALLLAIILFFSCRPKKSSKSKSPKDKDRSSKTKKKA